MEDGKQYIVIACGCGRGLQQARFAFMVCLPMNSVANVVRWTARIFSGIALLFVSVFLIMYFVGDSELSSGPLRTSDYYAIATSIVLLGGLAIGWKWELAGGGLILIGCLVFQLQSGKFFMQFPLLLVPITGILFLASWGLRRNSKDYPPKPEDAD